MDEACYLVTTPPQAKRKMPLFSECQSSFLGGCRVSTLTLALTLPLALTLALTLTLTLYTLTLTLTLTGGCRVWVEPVTAGLRPMLHGE